MIYLLHGTDIAKSRKKLNSLINSLISKKKDATLIKINSDNLNLKELSDYSNVQGLFESRSIIVLDELLQNITNKEIVVKTLERFKDSQNIFIFIESKLDKKTLSKFEKFSEKIQKFSLREKNEAKSKFNIFELSDELGRRDRKKMWVMYQTGKLNNISSEEMHGILFWGVKNMVLAKNSKDASEANLSSFVYSKSFTRESVLSKTTTTDRSSPPPARAAGSSSATSRTRTAPRPTIQSRY